MTPVVIQYPLDLTGRNPDNLVVGERHGPCGPGNRVFVLNYGPFYTKRLVLRNASTQAELIPNVDYKAIQTFIEPTLKTGQLICSIIQIQPTAYNIEIDVDYQVLGGDYSLSTTALETLIADIQGDDRPVRWGEIIGKPEAYPPTPHIHDINDVFGWQYLCASLEAVRQAILIGDPSADEDFYAYVDQKFATAMAATQDVSDDLNAHLIDYNNPHHVTKDQLGLGNVGNYGLATPQVARLNISHETLITPFTAPHAIEFHTGDMDNPHGTTKGQVGLGNVDNFPTATPQQAIDGTDNASFLTPYLMKLAYEEWGGGTPPPPPVTPPQAKFTYTGSRSVPVGTDPVITFTSTSIAGTNPITGYQWNFGNGQTSTLQAPAAVTYTFPELSRSFLVTLQVTDSAALTNSTSQSLAMTHVEPQDAPGGFDLYVNGAVESNSSQIETTGGPANHSVTYSVSVPTVGTGPYNYSWIGDAIVDQYAVGGIGGTSWSYSGKSPPTKTYSIPIHSNGWYWRQNVTVTATSQANGFASSRSGYMQFETVQGATMPVAAISLNSGASNLNSPNSTLTAVFNNNSYSPAGAETIGDSSWSFSTTAGTCSPATSSGVGVPGATTSVVNPPVGSGTLTASLIVTTSPSSHQDSTSLNVGFVRQPPALVGPTANFTGNMTYNSGNDTSSIAVSNTSTQGDAAITSWSWTVTWENGDIQTSSVRNPPAFTNSGFGSNRNKSATVNLSCTDANGLSSNKSLSFNVPFTPISRTYTSGSGSDTAPMGCTTVTITAAGGGASGGAVDRWSRDGAGGGGAGGMSVSTYAIAPGQTLNYSVGLGGKPTGPLEQVAGTATSVSSGSKSITSLIANGGNTPTGTGGGAGGTATGGNVSNQTGLAGDAGTTGDAGGAGDLGYAGFGGEGGAGPGGSGGRGADGNDGPLPGVNMHGDWGQDGWVIFEYS